MCVRPIMFYKLFSLCRTATTIYTHFVLQQQYAFDKAPSRHIKAWVRCRSNPNLANLKTSYNYTPFFRPYTSEKIYALNIARALKKNTPQVDYLVVLAKADRFWPSFEHTMPTNWKEIAAKKNWKEIKWLGELHLTMPRGQCSRGDHTPPTNLISSLI